MQCLHAERFYSVCLSVFWYRSVRTSARVATSSFLKIPEDTRWNAHGNSLPCLPRPTYQTTHHLRDKLTSSLGKENGRGGCCALNSLLVCVQELLSEGRGSVFLSGQTWSTGDTFITPAPESLCNLAIFFSKLWRGFLKLFQFSIKMGHKNEVSICYQVLEVKVYRNNWKIKMTSHQEQLNTYCNLGRRRCL